MNPTLASDTESERHIEQDPRPQARGPAYLRVRLCSGPQRTDLGSWFLAVEGQDSALCLCPICLAVAKAPSWSDHIPKMLVQSLLLPIQR